MEEAHEAQEEREPENTEPAPSIPRFKTGSSERPRKAKAEAVLMLDSPRFSNDRAEISALLLKHRLPGIGTSVQHAEAGVLLSFSANQAKAARRTAELGVQILKGAKAASIPVEQADELVAATMKRLAEIFSDEREQLEREWDRGEDISTEDLRIALQRYRSFFDRLLSV